MFKQDFKLYPSKQYLILIGLMLILSLAAIFSLTFPLWAKGLLLLVVFAYLAHIYWHFACLKAAFSITELKHIEAKQWQLRSPSGIYEAVLRGDSTVTGLVSVLRFEVQDSGAKLNCLVFPDSLQPFEYKQLLLILRNK